MEKNPNASPSDQFGKAKIKGVKGVLGRSFGQDEEEAKSCIAN